MEFGKVRVFLKGSGGAPSVNEPRRPSRPEGSGAAIHSGARKKRKGFLPSLIKALFQTHKKASAAAWRERTSKLSTCEFRAVETFS
ncbi:hypothetical protein [Methylocystis sp. JR02]|uniref:hypothetical protein n=1 Tax=Methylocystis sp. JR02 TaxID=3046284 RepID=UPI0024B99A11|nr:hypothetical protein [Methylocystis sp. JR02]MDJ0447321.1 hypothetical protein [Methylocystis sp. JR02]